MNELKYVDDLNSTWRLFPSHVLLLLQLNVSVVLYKGAKKKNVQDFAKLLRLKQYVELLKDLDWPLVQIMYFAKIVGFALE